MVALLVQNKNLDFISQGRQLKKILYCLEDKNRAKILKSTTVLAHTTVKCQFYFNKGNRVLKLQFPQIIRIMFAECGEDMC